MGTNRLGEWFVAKNNPPTVLHVTQTAIAVMISLSIARLFRLPEAYWAPMSTLIAMQSTFDAALPISLQYFAGTAVGAAFGAVVDTYFHGNVWAFGGTVVIVGLIGVALQVERSAFRYAGITLAIVILVPHPTRPGVAALHRFFEVSIGLSVGLATFALWQKIGSGLTPRADVERTGST